MLVSLPQKYLDDADCDTDIQGVPTLRVYQGGERKMDYEGKRETADMKSFVKNLLKKGGKKITQKKVAQKKITQRKSREENRAEENRAEDDKLSCFRSKFFLSPSFILHITQTPSQHSISHSGFFILHFGQFPHLTGLQKYLHE